MSAWVKEHFRDEQHARVTLAKVTAVASVVGLALVLLGYVLA
jgi:hypothetical protein